MQQLFAHPRRTGASIVLAMLALSACTIAKPYGPAIPGTGTLAAPAADEDDQSSAGREATGGRATIPGESIHAARMARNPLASPERFRSRADSIAWADGVRRAKADKRRRVVVSLDARMLWLLERDDTLRVAPVAIGTEERLVHGKHEWVFETPRGVRSVKGKAPDPTWTPPLWHYVKEAKRHGVELAVMPANGRMVIGNGERLEVRNALVGRWSAGKGWRAWPVDDEIIIGDTLYVPPFGTKNRVQHGQLGAFKLDTGDGYLIHGSVDPSSIGTAATHGCLRLAADDLAFIYARVPVGTPVYIL